MEKPKLLWFQLITCNGNSHSFFNHPELFSIIEKFEIVYYPLIDSKYNLSDILTKDIKCDILIVEGAFRDSIIVNDINISKKVLEYAKKAKFIITAGTCATYGGIFKEYDSSLSGFCFNKSEKNNNYSKFKDKLISIPGCPIHPKWLGFILLLIANKKKIVLDEFNRPKELFAYTVHTGCVRNEYFEWKIDTKGFGHKEGCSFYENGCQGPFTRGSCNKILWNDISSKTVVGTPCFGCTEPEFPKRRLFFTKTNMGIPLQTPLGVSKRAYLTLTGVAKSFKISRLEDRLIDYDS